MYKEIKAYLDKGLSIKQIANLMHLTENRVNQLIKEIKQWN